MTRRMVVLGSRLIGVALAGTLAAGCAVAGADPAAVEAEVRAAVEARATALRDGTPREPFYRADYVATLSNGRIADGTMAAAFARSPGYTEQDVVVRVVGDAALVTGMARLDALPRGRRFVALWVRDGGRWQAAMLHGTDISGTDSPAAPTRADAPADVPITPTTTGAEAELLAAQTAREAISRAKDVAAYDAQTAVGAQRITPAGRLDDRTRLIEDFKASGGGLVLGPQVVRVYSDLAVVFTTQGVPLNRRATRIWVREEGRWKYLSSAVSPITTAAPVPGELRTAIAVRQKGMDTRTVADVERFTAADYSLVTPLGAIQDKATRLRDLPKTPPSSGPSATEELALVYGDAAVVRLRTTGGHVINVWARQPAGWQAVYGHVTGTAAEPAGLPPPPIALEPEWIAPVGLSADAAEAFKTHAELQRSGTASDRSTYSRLTANEFVRIRPPGVVDREAWFGRLFANRAVGPGGAGAPGPPHDQVTVRSWDRVAVIRWRTHRLNQPASWVSAVLTKNPWGWQRVVSIETPIAAEVPSTR